MGVEQEFNQRRLLRNRGLDLFHRHTESAASAPQTGDAASERTLKFFDLLFQLLLLRVARLNSLVGEIFGGSQNQLCQSLFGGPGLLDDRAVFRILTCLGYEAILEERI